MEERLTPYAQMILRLHEKKRSCSACPNYTNKGCGQIEYHQMSSSGGRMEKVPDERCFQKGD